LFTFDLHTPHWPVLWKLRVWLRDLHVVLWTDM
jgi:hypothetical protein